MAEQKSIMHLSATDFFGGPEKQIVEHLKRLNKDRFDGQIASYLEYGGPNELLEKARQEGLKAHGIPMHGPLDFTAQFKLNNLIRHENIDLLCVHGYKACVMGWWVAKMLKIPIIAFSRGYTSENLKIAFYNWLERLFLRRMNGIVTVSEGQKRKLEIFGIRNRNCWVVHNAVSIPEPGGTANPAKRLEVFKKLDIPEGAKLVVAAGRFSPEKGHRFLLEAVAQMGEGGNGAVFLLCGEGTCEKDLKKQAKALEIIDCIRFAGFRKDLADIFRVMDLMVLPSLAEGLPNVVLEALALAKPVVATRVGGVPEVIEDGVSGLLVPAERSDLLADAITKCLIEPERAKTMGISGYYRIKSEFDFFSQNYKLENIYKTILCHFTS